MFRKRKRLHSEPEGEEEEGEEEGEELSLLEYLRRRDEKNVSGKKRKRVRHLVIHVSTCCDVHGGSCAQHNKEHMKT